MLEATTLVKACLCETHGRGPSRHEQDRKARYLGCALAGNLPTVSAHAGTTSGASGAGAQPPTPSEKSGVSTMSPASSLKQQHQHFRISDYHFDVFLDHVRRALAGEDPEARCLVGRIAALKRGDKLKFDLLELFVKKNKS